MASEVKSNKTYVERLILMNQYQKVKYRIAIGML